MHNNKLRAKFYDFVFVTDETKMNNSVDMIFFIMLLKILTLFTPTLKISGPTSRVQSLEIWTSAPIFFRTGSREIVNSNFEQSLNSHHYKTKSLFTFVNHTANVLDFRNVQFPQFGLVEDHLT